MSLVGRIRVSWFAPTLPASLKLLSATICLLVALVASPLRADEGEVLAEPYSTWERTAEFAEVVLEERSALVEELEKLRARLAEHREAAFALAESGSVEVRSLEAQLGALGEPPPEGENETEEVAARRAELNKKLAIANAPIVASREAYERADLLIGEIDALIREQTTAKWLTRSPSPLLPTRWVPAFGELIDYGEQVAGEFRRNLRYPAERDRLREAAPSILFTTVIGLILLILVQPFVTARLARAAQRTKGNWRRLSYNILRNLCYLIVPGLGAAAILMAIPLAEINLPSANALIEAAPVMAGIVVLGHWLARSLFAPVGDHKRVFELDDKAGDLGLRICTALGLLLAVQVGFEATQKDFAFSPATTAVIAGLITFVGSVLLWVLARLIHSSRDDDVSAAEDYVQTNFPALLVRLMQISAVLGGLFAATGFVELAREALIPMIISIGLIGFTYFFYRVVMRAVEIITGRDYAGGEDQGSLLPFAVASLLSLALLPVLALAWGARTADISEVWRLLIEGVEFGETRISLEALIKLVVVFGFGMLLTRWLQKLLRTTVLPRTRLDAGGQTALVTGIGYVGLTLAALAAVSAAGLDLSSLAVVAGALSVGIGFGLQTVVSNFVSGIILLIERPIKEGDWIEVSGNSGFVRKIAVRSTRIETFDHHDVIVPNSELIAGTVKNMTLSSMKGRLIVPVGVAYGSDLERTKEILVEAAKDHPMVMQNPEPSVLFIGLGENSLDFELRCILEDIGATVSAKSELLFRIYVELGKAGIEIPFPQRDIHLRDIDRLIGAIEGRGTGGEKPGGEAEAAKLDLGKAVIGS